ncbi:cation diffusion facilitator family transporter [Clostridium thermobutyricum]|uniref:Cation diffusion facilitator family transporter n=1 Tax=Clostridium thermobutyricum TaxID=29372 RepID=N9Y5R3_9CLOT|nr:cation diffusion facilitator family transporter [Clostridium thermobutyricum]ENZ03127.1 cation diffusion facilitator family transporter [Clostridium thermobutyricum]
MLSKFLVNTFIKDNNNTKEKKVRNKFGVLGGAVGIVVNLILVAIKVSVGLITGSIAITADGFNNLSDAASSIITIAGFKLSNMPADKEHPFGHGRIEYISSLIVSFLVILVGLEFVKSSAIRIFNPSKVDFEIIPFILLIVSILLKLWLAGFNRYIGNKIDSKALKAAAVDSLGDVFASTCVSISFLASKFTNFPIDGYVGVVVALIIVYSGVSLVKETLNPLLGEAPDPELVKELESLILSYPHITGIHDLIIHNYGPGRCMASVHAEIPSDMNIMEIHNIIDKAEREISQKLELYLVIHMDPICLSDDEIKVAYTEVSKIIKYNPLIKSMHDFRIVGEGDEKNLIFDVVVDSENLKKIMDEQALKNDIIEAIKELHPEYNCIITIDHDYT